MTADRRWPSEACRRPPSRSRTRSRTKGRRMIDLEYYKDGSSWRVAAIWVQNKEGRSYKYQLGVLKTEYYDKLNSWKDKYVPVDVDIYEKGGSLRSNTRVVPEEERRQVEAAHEHGAVHVQRQGQDVPRLRCVTDYESARIGGSQRYARCSTRRATRRSGRTSGARTRRMMRATHLFSTPAATDIWRLSDSCWTEAATRSMRRVQRGHDRSFRPYRLWDGVPFSGADGCTNRGQDSGAAGAGTRGTGRTSGSFDERARSATAPAVRLVVRIGTAAGLVVQGQQEGHTRGRVVCVGIDNPGSNVSPSSSPVWQWGGARF